LRENPSTTIQVNLKPELPRTGDLGKGRKEEGGGRVSRYSLARSGLRKGEGGGSEEGEEEGREDFTAAAS